MPSQHVYPQVLDMVVTKRENAREFVDASFAVDLNHPHPIIVAVQAECKIPAELYIEPGPIVEEFNLVHNDVHRPGTSSLSIDFGWNTGYEPLKHRGLGQIMHYVVKPTGAVPATAH